MLRTARSQFEAAPSLNRASNFEVLRIIATFMIVSHHYAGDRSFVFDRNSPTYRWLNEYWVRSMETTGKIGVTVFLLMTGYFQNYRSIKVSSIARTWFKTLCWSYLIAFGWYLMGRDAFEFGWKPVILPVFNNNYWFVTTYIVAACCSGWTAAICECTTPSQYLSGLVTMFTVMSLLQWDWFIAFCNTQWFIFVIALGGFLRRFSKNLRFITTKMLLIALGTLASVVWISIYVFLFYNVEWAARHGGTNALVRENWCVTSLFIGVILVMLVDRTKVFVSLAINRLSSLSLGVYLVHEHILMRNTFWREFVAAVRFRDHKYLPLICFYQVLTVYLSCSMLEFIRQLVLGPLETLFAGWISRVAGKVSEDINDILDRHEKV